MNILIKWILILVLVGLSQSCNPRYYKQVEREFDTINETKYPWLVVVKATDRLSTKLRLSYGSLIHPKAVLTAAIGVREYSGNTLVVQTECQPSSSTSTKKELGLIRCVNRDVIRNVYSKNSDWQNPTQNDFAILILNETLKMGDGINVINLAQSVEDIDVNNCVYTRWMREFILTSSIKRKLVIAPYKTSYNNGLLNTGDFNSDQLISDRDWIIGEDFHMLHKKSHRNPLNFMGSPLACQLKGQQTYVQVGIGTFNMVIFLNYDDKSIREIQQEGSLINIIHQRDEIMQLLGENVELHSFMSTSEFPSSLRSIHGSIPTSTHGPLIISTSRPLTPNYVYSPINREQGDRSFRNSFSCC